MSRSQSCPDTVVSCLTPPGTGAIAVLGVHGPEAWQVARKLFRLRSSTKPELPEQPAPGQFWLGKFGEELADEAVLTLKGMAPVPCIELHVHGGQEVIRWLQETFAVHGIRSCSWQDFVGRTMDDPAQAAAIAALAEAPTTRTASILLDQFHGAFSRAVGAVQSAAARNDPAEASRLLENLTRYSSCGRHLTTPWQVVIAGAPNVGKSSLVNALAGFQRTIVAPTPGTTRDVVRTQLAIDGWPVEVADTAGVRETTEHLEAAGVGLTREAARQADLCLWLLDASALPSWPNLPASQVRLVVNKIDLPPAWDLDQAEGAIRVSALTGAGLPELCEALSQWLVPDPPLAGAAVPFTAEMARQLEEVREYLAAGRGEAAREVLRRVWHNGPA